MNWECQQSFYVGCGSSGMNNIIKVLSTSTLRKCTFLWQLLVGGAGGHRLQTFKFVQPPPEFGSRDFLLTNLFLLAFYPMDTSNKTTKTFMKDCIWHAWTDFLQDFFNYYYYYFQHVFHFPSIAQLFPALPFLSVRSGHSRSWYPIHSGSPHTLARAHKRTVTSRQQNVSAED